MRNVMVTGGAGGLGSAICRRLARAGDRIVVADRDLRAAQAVAAQLGDRHLGIGMDAGNEAEVIAAFEAAEAGGDPLSVLVACAGGTLLPPGPFVRIADTGLDNWIATEAMNARGSFLCVREVLRRRAKQPVANGRIVLFSSAAAQRAGGPTGVAYVASKAAVLGLTKQAAIEAAPLGITVNAIAPGAFDTPALHVVNPPAAIEAIKKLVPLGRIGTADEMAALVEFVAGAEAGYITGAVFDINGGARMA